MSDDLIARLDKAAASYEHCQWEGELFAEAAAALRVAPAEVDAEQAAFVDGYRTGYDHGHLQYREDPDTAWLSSKAIQYREAADRKRQKERSRTNG